MPRGSSPKREREYRELKDRFETEDRYPGREEEVAARIVNKQRREHGETRSEAGAVPEGEKSRSTGRRGAAGAKRGSKAGRKAGAKPAKSPAAQPGTRTRTPTRAQGVSKAAGRAGVRRGASARSEPRRGPGRPRSAAASRLPVDDYTALTVGQVIQRIQKCSPRELDLIRQFERDHRNRRSLVAELDRRIKSPARHKGTR